MKKCITKHLVLMLFIIASVNVFAQAVPEAGDPRNNINIPDFYRSKLSDVETALNTVRSGKVKTIADSPGGLPVYAVYYGEKDDFHSQANYNSAVGARNAAFYAKKTKETKPVLFFVGPVHGHEVEGMVGLVNLIQIAETGKDLRGKEWPLLKKGIEQCRVIILPCNNPDGRMRCPYDSFVGIPSLTMTKYGQGTHKDGSLWRWPHSKALHPMKGDVEILGCYYNNDGINPMHDDFFFPMAEETKAILKIARDEAPDMTVSLHSQQLPPCVHLPAYVPHFLKQKVADFGNHMNNYFKEEGLPHYSGSWEMKAQTDDEIFPPRKPFNLVSALHHISGTMSFTFECCHGTDNSDREYDSFSVTHDDILDIQLGLYQEMFNYVLENRLYWE
ncbi:MAG: M14 family zinc carboxypeptidase [Mangrovibacterium sp.]|nr:M14 family zinc carboxypeptidase [Mangrovibacterium sp.]